MRIAHSFAKTSLTNLVSKGPSSGLRLAAQIQECSHFRGRWCFRCHHEPKWIPEDDGFGGGGKSLHRDCQWHVPSGTQLSGGWAAYGDRFPHAQRPLHRVNDGVDSERGEDDFTPFRNIMNDNLE